MTADQAALTEAAPTKLNLSLRVVGRRQDGYHLVDSVVVFAALADTVALRPADAFGLTVNGPFAAATPTSHDNLVLRAATGLGALLGKPVPGALHLTKRLPVAAGVGGGSSDAAATLRLLCRHWSVDPDDARVAELALSLGADVPVCLARTRCRMSGIGETVAPLAPLPPRPVVMVNPGVALATGDVFRRLLVADPVPDILSDAASVNDLFAPALCLAPSIGDVIRSLAATEGCRTAAMSGSGPTCFGLYDNDSEAGAAADAIRKENPDWWVAATRLLD